MKYADMHFVRDIHFVRERVGWKWFHVVRVNTHQQLADCFTKPLSGLELCAPRRRLGVVGALNNK
jgi:hypothetical protein